MQYHPVFMHGVQFLYSIALYDCALPLHATINIHKDEISPLLHSIGL